MDNQLLFTVFGIIKQSSCLMLFKLFVLIIIFTLSVFPFRAFQPGLFFRLFDLSDSFGETAVLSLAFTLTYDVSLGREHAEAGSVMKPR